MKSIITAILAFFSLLGFNQPADTIKIGLLVNDLNSQAAINGAELAIRKANEKGGYKGKPFQLEIRSMEGPWGTGSKQAVDLIFQKNVCAIMGSHDGRNAHLVEQVTTKARTVFLSAWASEPTLSQAFVPWFFTCTPNDLQQADALIDEIYNKRKINTLVVVSDNGYDSRSALENFIKINKASEKNSPIRFKYGIQDNLVLLADSINRAKADGIILLGKPAPSMELLKLLKQRNSDKTIFGSLALLASDQDIKSYDNAVVISPVKWSDKRASVFYEEYNKTFGLSPGAVSAYAYDAMTLIISAVINAGTERENIQKYLAKVNFGGVTGQIQFDEKGKRIGIPELIQIKK